MKPLSLVSLSLAAAMTAQLGCDTSQELAIGEDIQEIIGGFPLRSARLDAIGALVAIDEDGGVLYQFCSGTLIAPNVVLTAEHCVDAAPEPYGFAIGWNAYAPKDVVRAVGAVREETIFGGGLGLGSDIAVVHLETPVEGVTPLPYAATPAERVGERFIAVGYGYQDNYGTSGTREAGSVTLRAVGGLLFPALFGSLEAFLAAVPEFDPNYDPNDPAWVAAYTDYYENFTLLDGYEAAFGNAPHDAQACFGDSGGPVIGRHNGVLTAFGAASWVFESQSQACDFVSTYATLGPAALQLIEREIACPLYPAEGFCEGETAVRCTTEGEGDFRPVRTDCGSIGLTCGTDELGEIGCVFPDDFGLDF